LIFAAFPPTTMNASARQNASALPARRRLPATPAAPGKQDITARAAERQVRAQPVLMPHAPAHFVGVQ